MQLQAQARVRELHRDAQARDIQEKQEKKEKKKRKKAEEEKNSELSVPVKDEQEKTTEETPQQVSPPPVPAKKFKKTQGVTYANAAMEEFFTSPATTAPDVQNPGIKFVTIFVV